MQGKGVQVSPNGDRYEGNFINNLRDGYGVYTFARAGDKYEGSFKEGRLHGEGIMTYAGG